MSDVSAIITNPMYLHTVLSTMKRIRIPFSTTKCRRPQTPDRTTIAISLFQRNTTAAIILVPRSSSCHSYPRRLGRLRSTHSPSMNNNSRIYESATNNLAKEDEFQTKGLSSSQKIVTACTDSIGDLHEHKSSDPTIHMLEEELGMPVDASTLHATKVPKEKEGHSQPNLDKPAVEKRLSRFGMYSVISFFMVFCLVYSVITAFAPMPTGLLSSECSCRGIDQCICITEEVEAYTAFELFCLANARASAYCLYPLYIIMFLSMSRNLRTKLQRTIVAEFIPLTSLHALHAWAGTLIGVVIFWHALWHFIRWGVQGKLLSMTFATQVGITGFIALVITPVLVWPMRLAKLRSRINFETRKRMHYLSWVWAALLCFHSPASRIFWIIGSAFLVYLVDWIYGLFMTTHLVPSARFVLLESAIMIRVQKPDGFHFAGSGGYCYLCVPWISKYEWHTFSAYKDPFDSEYVCFCISVVGDWTKKLQDEIREPIYRRLWICGPFASPFEKACLQDNTISIASGIGITPAVSAINSLSTTRKMHLIWICREAGLVEFMVDYGAMFDDEAYTFVFYTGKRELVFRRKLPPNLFLLKGRPDLSNLIAVLVRNGGDDCDELDLSSYEKVNNDLMQGEDVEGVPSAEQRFYTEMLRLLFSYTAEELFNDAVRRSRFTSRCVCYDGLKELVDDIFDRKLSDEQLRIVFDRIDHDKNGSIEFEEFNAFIKEMEEDAAKDSKRQRLALEDFHETMQRRITSRFEPGTRFTEEVDTPGWRLMYCGGSDGIITLLQAISKKNHVPLSIESFRW